MMNTAISILLPHIKHKFLQLSFDKITVVFHLLTGFKDLIIPLRVDKNSYSRQGRAPYLVCDFQTLGECGIYVCLKENHYDIARLGDVFRAPFTVLSPNVGLAVSYINIYKLLWLLLLLLLFLSHPRLLGVYLKAHIITVVNF